MSKRTQMGTMFGALLDEHVGNTKEGRRARLVAQARNAGFFEKPASELKPWRRYLADRVTGRLFQVVTHQVLEVNGQREGDAFLFFVDDSGQLVFLTYSDGPGTIAEVEALEAEEARGVLEAAKARAEEYARRPQRELTLADIEGHKLPTLAAAAKVIADHGGTIEKQGDELHIRVASDLAHRHSIVVAARVIAAAQGTVLEALSQRSGKPLHERLPDAPVSATGTVC
jgi:hypothetical protein